MLLIKGALHLDAKVDLLVNGAEIAALTPAGRYQPADDWEVVDAKGLRLLPALIDAHAHLREPGQEYKEDIASGLTAASRGGFGSVMCMANTVPVNDSATVTSFMLAAARKSHPEGPVLFPIAAATIGLAGKELAPLAELAEAGCVAVSNDGKPVASAEIVRRVMEYAADLGLRFIDHCEDPALAQGWVMNEGEISGRMGVKGQPWAGEAIQVARDLLLAEYLRLPIHIAHVSNAASVHLIRAAKEKGVQVTAETCPHYLLLTDAALENYNTLAKVSPPLRREKDRLALLEAIKSGVIDILVTDHAPHTFQEKNTTLDNAPFGISGLDLALPLTFSLIEAGAISEADCHRLWATGPASIFGLPVNEFSPGNPADFILYDENAQWEAVPENFYSKSANTPFLNQMIKGRVKHQWLRGKRIF